MKIPNKFKVGCQDLNVVFKDTIYGDKMGECCLWSGNIQISEMYKGEPQTDSSKFNTFYHELTHSILDTMGEFELSANERFVCSFSGFLSEAIRSFEFNKEQTRDFKHELEYYLYILNDESLTYQDKVEVLCEKIKERIKNI